VTAESAATFEAAGLNVGLAAVHVKAFVVTETASVPLALVLPQPNALMDSVLVTLGLVLSLVPS